MPTIFATDTDGNAHEVTGKAGDTLMDALQNANIAGVEAICGGACSCATCHVHVAADWVDKLGERNEVEEILVSATDAFDPAASRLSCQVELTDEMDGLTVVAQIPE